MRVQLLGSGAGTGFPAWNDGSENALRARTEDTGMPRREATALAVSADGERYSLVEAPFHLAGSLARHPELAPRPGSRSAPIDSLLLTSADLDACAGALALRRGLSIRICSSRTIRGALLDHDAAFRSLEAVWTGLAWDRPVPLDRDGALEARLFPLPGPPPDHLREAAPAAGRGRAGVRITDRRTGARLVWAPRIERLDSATLAELREADLRFVDGTCFAADEARRLRPGTPSSVDLGHVPIDGRDGSLAWLSGMRGRSFYVHLAATNPACDEKSEAAERIRRAGVGIAFDGLELSV